MTTCASGLRRFPFSDRLVVCADAGREAAAVRHLAGTADWRRTAVNHAAGLAIVLTGPRLLRPSPGWAWPELGPDDVRDRLREYLPGVRIVGAALPRQRGRRRLSLLTWYGGTKVVIKLGAVDADAAIETERRVLEILSVDPIPGIATPRVVASGELPSDSGPVVFLATTSLGLGGQRAAMDARLGDFEQRVAERLSSLPRPDAASELVPVHGDLTPWNLRRTGRGLALFDWESAGWGPPGSDLARYRRTCDELRSRSRVLRGWSR